MTKPLICIGELVHASIPRTGQMMKQLALPGDDACCKSSEPLDYIKNLIESQASDGADYIAVNLDAFGETDAQIAVSMMSEYVKLVRKWGKGVPICIDSSNDDVLATGLRQWYDTDDDVKQPLVNSIKAHTMDKLLALKKQYDYAFIGLLVSEGKPTGPGGLHSVDELYLLAKRILDEAVGKYGFKAEEIFFDSTVYPLAIDMPMESGVPGYTYRAFETIRKIKNDHGMQDVHFSLGISNCCRDLPARKIGICRAYVEKAIEYGLDTVIANPAYRFGEKKADPELVKLVDAFAKMDGSAQRQSEAMMLMAEFCQKSRS